MPTRSISGSTATKNPPGNQTPNTPDINESEIARLKVDELRDRLRRRGVTDTADMKKDDLVKTLVKSLRDGSGPSGSSRSSGSSGSSRSSGSSGSSRSPGSSGGVRTGAQTSRSLKYSQVIDSVDDEPERPGRSLVTTDHEVIRQWAEARKGVPCTVDGTDHDGHAGVLRFDFPANGREDRLREISWQEWFEAFDKRRLNFIYQEERSDGRQSNFFRLESPDREDG
jgi:hypothetical protein